MRNITEFFCFFFLHQLTFWVPKTHNFYSLIFSLQFHSLRFQESMLRLCQICYCQKLICTNTFCNFVKTNQSQRQPTAPLVIINISPSSSDFETFCQIIMFPICLWISTWHSPLCLKNLLQNKLNIQQDFKSKLPFWKYATHQLLKQSILLMSMRNEH